MKREPTYLDQVIKVARDHAELQALVSDGVDSHPETDVVGAVKHIIKMRDELFAELTSLRAMTGTDIPAIERTALEAALFGGEVPLVSAESIAWIQGVAVRVKANTAAVERERDDYARLVEVWRKRSDTKTNRIAELETLLHRARRELIGSKAQGAGFLRADIDNALAPAPKKVTK